MKIKIALIFFFITISNSNELKSNQDLFNNLKGCFCEGGFMIGKVGESEVRVDNVLQTISNDGYFIYAFRRKSNKSVEVKINQDTRTFDVKKKKYLIERINNLPRGKVDPSKESIKKIIKDKKRIDNAKEIGVNQRLFGKKFMSRVFIAIELCGLG